MNKLFLCALFLLLDFLCFQTPVFAESSAPSASETERYSQEIAEKSGAADLEDKLPAETKKILSEKKADGKAVTSVTPQN